MEIELKCPSPLSSFYQIAAVMKKLILRAGSGEYLAPNPLGEGLVVRLGGVG